MINKKMDQRLAGGMTALLTVALVSVFCNCDNPLVTDILPPRNQTGALVDKPAVVGLPDPESITVGRVDLRSSTGQTVEYAVSTSPKADADKLSWQTHTTTFHGLCSDTVYYVYARSMENPNYNAGECNISDPILFYTVYFHGNGEDKGEPPVSKTVLTGSVITIPEWGTLAKNAKAFGHWNTRIDDSGTEYTPGEDYIVTHDEDMYVIWYNGQTLNFSIPVASVSAAEKDSRITISQTASNNIPYTAELIIDNASEFQSIEWNYDDKPLVYNTASYTLNARRVEFNEPGKHVITAIGWKNGQTYKQAIAFNVVE